MTATPGRSRLDIPKAASVVALAAAITLSQAPAIAAAAPSVRIMVPAGTLDRALVTLAMQAGIDIGGTVPGLDAVASPAVRGRIAPAEALRRLLTDTPFEAQAIGQGSYRIVRRPAAATPPPRSPSRPSQRASPPSDAAGEIVVLASKRGTSLQRFPGSAASIPLDPFGGHPGSAGDLTELASALPILQSTDLGPGRNKIFVRGVADSSFNGPSQSVTGLYFGDVQVGYAGPDPNLDLFDVGRVEVVEGPQGTLYGAGAIGGVITLTPNAPDLDRFGGTIRAGITATQGGAPGYDGAAMLNVPLVADSLAIRAVAYRQVDGGYIDDLARGRHDVNRTIVDGGRAALRYRPAPGWTIDASTILQAIDARDAQYAERGLPGEARRSTLAQPFSDRFLLGRLVIGRQWDSGLHLISATGWVDRNRNEAFDATGLFAMGRPLIYAVNSTNRLFSQETRLSRSTANGASWVVGGAVLVDREQFNRTLGTVANPVDINGVTNRTVSIAGFGEATVPITKALALTGGGRLTRARTDGDPTTTTRNTVFVHGRISFRLDPAIGANLSLTPTLGLYARYQSGFRTGGLAVARGVGRVANFDADTIGVIETGVRLRRIGATGLAGTLAYSHARWEDIQADLVTARGLPYSSNIGQGVIDGVEATADWIPIPQLQITGAMFVARSRLKDPVAALEAERGSALPNVPRIAIGADAAWRRTLGAGQTLRLFAGLHYRSHSVLGTGPLLQVRQGNYADQSLGATWSRGRWTVTAQLDNPFDSNGERFALGNPFQLAIVQQYTPIRPRNLHVAAAYSW